MHEHMFTPCNFFSPAVCQRVGELQSWQLQQHEKWRYRRDGSQRQTAITLGMVRLLCHRHVLSVVRHWDYQGHSRGTKAALPWHLHPGHVQEERHRVRKNRKKCHKKQTLAKLFPSVATLELKEKDVTICGFNTCRKNYYYNFTIAKFFHDWVRNLNKTRR